MAPELTSRAVWNKSLPQQSQHTCYKYIWHSWPTSHPSSWKITPSSLNCFKVMWPYIIRIIVSICVVLVQASRMVEFSFCSLGFQQTQGFQDYSLCALFTFFSYTVVSPHFPTPPSPHFHWHLHSSWPMPPSNRATWPQHHLSIKTQGSEERLRGCISPDSH